MDNSSRTTSRYQEHFNFCGDRLRHRRPGLAPIYRGFSALNRAQSFARGPLKRKHRSVILLSSDQYFIYPFLFTHLYTFLFPFYPSISLFRVPFPPIFSHARHADRPPPRCRPAISIILKQHPSPQPALLLLPHPLSPHRTFVTDHPSPCHPNPPLSLTSAFPTYLPPAARRTCVILFLFPSFLSPRTPLPSSQLNEIHHR